MDVKVAILSLLSNKATIAQPEPLLRQGSEKTNMGEDYQSDGVFVYNIPDDVLDSLFYLKNSRRYFLTSSEQLSLNSKNSIILIQQKYLPPYNTR